MPTIRRLLALLLLTTPLAAQPLMTMRMRDGSTREVQASAPRGHIVEFREPPLAAGGTRALASYRDTFARFRRDLGDARAGGPKANAEPRITHEFYRLFHGVSVRLSESEVASVRALPYVKAVHVDEPVEMFEDTTRIARIGADRVWSEWKTRGAGIVVAVIDTGIDATHPALAGKVIGGYDFVTDDGDPSDEQGHGTHVAGIIAGEGSGVQGVAPDVKLLSYRVLDENGQGLVSDIIEALEWAADPDRDNDFSDHVDVANLSLGSRAGSADSPTSVAADHAVQAGVVVCLSAGNSPGAQTIGSPAASRLAITVGATDANDQLTPWSSRGPAYPDLALKPEITAPGDDIVSAQMGGGVVAKSGTSMAAPHVAGAAALLLALHPEWSPADVKAALVASADAVAEEVMARGGGRLNVYEAAGSSIVVEPAAVTFGNGNAGAWTRSRTVRVTNHANAARTFTATPAAPDGITIIAEPATFTLDAGASRDVVLTATVGAGATPPQFTFSHGGTVSFRADGAAADVPWVAVDAARVDMVYDAPQSQVFPTWRCAGGAWSAPRYGGSGRWDALLPYERCGLTVGSVVQVGPMAGEVTVLYETHDVAADLQFERSLADSIHRIELAGVDAEGALIQPASLFGTPYSAPYFFEAPAGSLFALDHISTFSYLPLRVSTIPDVTVTAAQILFDFPRRRVVAVNHEPLRGGIHADVTLRSLPADLKHVRVNIAPQPARFRLQSSVVGFIGAAAGTGMGGGDLPLEHGWRGDVYVSAATNPNAWAAPAFGTGWLRLPDPESDRQSEGIRWIDGRFVMSNAKVPGPEAYSVAPGEVLRLGEAPFHARSLVKAGEHGLAVYASFFAPAGEISYTATVGFTYTLQDASGTVIREGTATANEPYASATGPRGAFRAVLRHGTTELALSFDTARPDFNPPVVTSFRILGSDGAITDALAPGEHATLAFTADDARTSRAFWRTTGNWQPLSGALPANGFGPVDLRVELEDLSGNTAVMTVEDAYSVGGRRRGVRR